MAFNANNNSSYVGAPYNFVPFAEKTYAPVTVGEMAIHDKLSDELVSGEISYSIEAKNPILVDGGNGHFYRDEYNRVVIPGSTMRGLIRSNAQILSMADVSKDIDDYNLMYRHVAAGALKKEYNNTLGNKTIPYGKGNISVLTNVKAGAISCKNGEYFIYPTKIQHIDNNDKLPNYYVLSERAVVADYLKNKNDFAYDFFVPDGRSIMQNVHYKPFRKEVKNGRVQYKGTTNDSYRPYSLPCSFKTKGKNVIAVSASGKLDNDGTAISTGKMQNKKAIYIIPEIDHDEAKKIKISDKDIKAYNIDYARKENTLAALFDKNKDEAKRFYGLPEEGKTKVCFYIELGKRLYFGFTPRLRLFYDHGIKEGLTQKTVEADRYDLCESIFGLSDENRGSFKSKVSFADAVLMSGEELRSVKVVLTEPKPSSYLDYIVQSQDPNQPASTYNSNGFRLRGIKQYWLHERIDLGTQNTKNEAVGSELYPYSEGSKFNGKIRFSNLTTLELGLLLWSLELDPDSQLNVGKGKPYGYGRIAFSNITLKTVDCSKAYCLDHIELDPFVLEEPEKYIAEYKKLVVFNKPIIEHGEVKNLLRIKNGKKMPEPSSIRYMSIDAKEYQSRKMRLKDIDEVLDDKKARDSRGSTENHVGSTVKVKVTNVAPDRKDPSKFVAYFNDGMVFSIPANTKKGDEILVKIKSENNNKKYADYVGKG